VAATQSCDVWLDPWDVEITWSEVVGATSYRVRAYDAGVLTALESGEQALAQISESERALLGEWTTDQTTRYAYAGSIDGEKILPCAVHAYTVSACNCVGCGPESTPVLGWSCEKAEAVSWGHISASAGDFPDRIEVTWMGYKGYTFDSYRIERSSSKYGAYSVVGTIAADTSDDVMHTFVDSMPGIPTPQAYFYRIRCCNTCSWGFPSMVVAGYTTGYTVPQNSCSDEDASASGTPGRIPPCFPIVTLQLTFNCDGVDRVQLSREGVPVAVFDKPAEGWTLDSEGRKVIDYVDTDHYGPGSLEENGETYTYMFALGDAFGYTTKVYVFVEMPLDEDGNPYTCP
jgi:hypothetical protein